MIAVEIKKNFTKMTRFYIKKQRTGGVDEEMSHVKVRCLAVLKEAFNLFSNIVSTYNFEHI